MDHQQPLHASTRVFAIPELVELILCHLSMLDILPLSRVSTTFYYTIHSYPSIKRKLFLTQPHMADIPNYLQFDRRHDPSSTPSTANTTATHPTFHGPMYARQLDTSLFNPALFKIFPHLTIHTLSDGNGWLLLTFPPLPQSPSLDQHIPDKLPRPTWKSMLLTAQPLTRLRLEPAARLVHPSNTAPLPRLPWSPDPPEAERIAALHARISSRRENSPRFGGGGDRPAALPPQTTLRWAAARGEASSDGWVWGNSLDFVSGRKPESRGNLESILVDETGIRLGQLERVVKARWWTRWVCRMECDGDVGLERRASV